MMIMSAQAVPYLTPEQYLEIERAAETRSEYLAGSVLRDGWFSQNHAQIVMTTGFCSTRNFGQGNALPFGRSPTFRPSAQSDHVSGCIRRMRPYQVLKAGKIPW